MNATARCPGRPLPGGYYKGVAAVITLVLLTGIDPIAIDALLDSAFGEDRRTRTAYLIRAGAAFDPALSYAGLDNGELVGLIQSWPISLLLDGGGTAPLLMVGPVAVLPSRQRDGIGRQLMMHMLATAATAGLDHALMLIGDPEYYGRFFGFSAARTGQWRAAGPVDRHRLLARGRDVPDVPGMLGPRV